MTCASGPNTEVMSILPSPTPSQGRIYFYRPSALGRRRELIRRLRTSATQFYRLLDRTNYRKSVDQLLSLLQILDCQVRLVVRPKTV